MWDLIVSFPDHCLSFYFDINVNVFKVWYACETWTSRPGEFTSDMQKDLAISTHAV